MSLDAPDRRIGGIIFDLDGVLADTEGLHARAWVKLLRAMGIHATARMFDRWIGIPEQETARSLIEEHGLSTSASDLIARRRRIYLGLVAAELEPFPGLIDRLAGLGMPCAVATSSGRRDAQLILDKLGARRYFGSVVTIEDVALGKPDPEIYRKAAADLQLPPGRCAAIEDSPTGARAAREAGCFVLGVTTTHVAGDLADVHRVFASTAEALDWLLSRGE